MAEWILWATLGLLVCLLLGVALALAVCHALALELSVGLRLIEGDRDVPVDRTDAHHWGRIQSRLPSPARW